MRRATSFRCMSPRSTRASPTKIQIEDSLLYASPAPNESTSAERLGKFLYFISMLGKICFIFCLRCTKAGEVQVGRGRARTLHEPVAKV